MNVLRPLLIFVICLTIGLSYGQKRKNAALNSPLFQEEDLLELDLTFDIKKVIKDLEERDSHYANLTFRSSEDELVSIDLKVKTRGNNRANPLVCDFPPLQLNFKKKGNYDNLFAGQDKLKLVTHCQKTKVFQEYVVQEYLTYKHYNVLTDHSFKVRLVRINYIDSATNETNVSRFGFLIEDDDIMAYRNGMEITKNKIKNQDYCDKGSLDIMTVFQYMIGNTDWSVSEGHNVKLMSKDPQGRIPVPIPYDFDYSGAIATYYSTPHWSLPIEDVKQRLFRGFCRQPGQYQKVFDLFNEKKDEIYAVYMNSEYITERNQKSTLKYLDSFYEVINDEKKAKREIIGACRISHDHLE